MPSKLAKRPMVTINIATSPRPEDIEALAVLAIHLSKDLEEGDVQNATEGARIVHALVFSLFVPAGEACFDAFAAWVDSIDAGARMQDAIDRLRAAEQTFAERLVDDKLPVCRDILEGAKRSFEKRTKIREAAKAARA